MVEAHPRPQHGDGELRVVPVRCGESSTALAMRDLSTAIQRVRLALARRAHLAPTDLQVLEQLLPGPMGYSELARRIGVTKSAVSNIALRLIGAGLVRRVFHADDRRRAFLELTELGREEMSSFLGPILAVLEALDQSVTPDERQVIGRYLRDATRAYEAVEALVLRSPPGVA